MFIFLFPSRYFSTPNAKRTVTPFILAAGASACMLCSPGSYYSLHGAFIWGHWSFVHVRACVSLVMLTEHEVT
jgi:hypothetical protein